MIIKKTNSDEAIKLKVYLAVLFSLLSESELERMVQWN